LLPHYIDPSGGVRRVDESIPIVVHNLLIRDDEPPTVDMMRRALTLAAEHREIDSIHRLLVSSNKYLHVENYRAAVLDASTATEIALARILEELVSASGIALKQKYMARLTSAARLLDEIEVLSGALPLAKNDLVTNISHPRNTAIHKGNVVSRAEAYTAVMFAKDFIYSRFPPG
jgi:hypothetical protein